MGRAEMTQEKRNTFLTSAPVPMLIMNREYDELSTDKNNSEDSQLRISEKAEKVIVELNLMYGESKKKILELIEVLRTEDKLKDNEIKKVLFAKVNFVSKATLYRALPQEFKKEYTAKALPKTINISSEHKVIDVEPNFPDHEEWKKDPEINRPIETTLNDQYVTKEEDPKDTEIDFLKEKVAELEDALKKTEQFKPATQLQEAKDPNPTPELQLTDDLVFQYLRDRAKETGNILIIDRVGAGALVQALAQYKNSFGVAELFLRVIQ